MRRGKKGGKSPVRLQYGGKMVIKTMRKSMTSYSNNNNLRRF